MSESSISIRQAVGIDLGSVVLLARRCVEAMRARGIDQWDEIYPNSKVLEQDIEGGSLYVCVEGERLLGCAALNDVQDPTYAAVAWQLRESAIGVIHRLMIDPDEQGRGLARKMALFVEGEAARKGIRVLRLDAFTQNPSALALYDRLGYRRAGIVQLRKGPFWCFEKPISSSSLAV